jgi:1-deoxy-D-xylulose-5-phosphate reductoisomerase
MRHPIQAALYYANEKLKVKSEKREECFGRLEFDSLSLDFSPPDLEKFPLLALAYEAVKKGGLYPCAYNGANEAAVAAFLKGRIGFLDIGRITRYVLERHWSAEPGDIASVMEADALAKKIVEKEIK